MTDSRPIRWFTELGVGDVALAGGKGANLGELTRAGLPVPPGFVITGPAYLHTMASAGLRDHLVRAVAGAAAEDPQTLATVATELTKLIRDAEIPPDVTEPVLAAYRSLGAGAVAVRSSATAEDSGGMSFAGMNETFTNVIGAAELLTCVKECWASAYTARAISYRAGQRLTDEPAMAVVVQAMVASDTSGVMFSADPTGDGGHIVIEGAFGLGEVVVSGGLVPDTYVLDRAGPRLLEIRIGYKDHKIVGGADGRDVRVDLSVDEATRRVLSDQEAVDLAELAIGVQEHYGSPQDLEWAIQDGIVYLVQSRPITTCEPVARPRPAGVRGRLVVGRGASPGVVSGNVRVLTSPEEGEQFRDGEILVAPMTSPDWMPILRRAAALVTDAGGITCHAAIVSRELGIPSIVGTETATHVLHDGQRISVDGRQGVVEEDL